MMLRRQRKEFPFSLAFGCALLLHVLMGIVLKHNPLLSAAPAAPSSASQPLSVRFVEVPPDAKSITEAPKTQNAADANYKAGPLVKREESREKSVERREKSAERRGDGRPVVASRGAAPAATVVPEIDSPELSRKGESGVQKDQGALLAKSLRNLDQFIASGNGKGQDGGEGGGPSGDPGSGVFFDTQGYDLGPWGNRVVAIVKGNWIIPVAAELGTRGIVGISFQIDKQGKILNPKIISSSKVPSFDQAALNALKSSDPLPPLPADFPRPVLPAVFRFYYNTPVPN